MPLKICKYSVSLSCISGCVKHVRKLPCGNSLFQFHILTRYLHYTMSTWGQYEKYTSEWTLHTNTKNNQAPGCPPFLTIYHPPNIEYSTRPNKKSFSSENCTQLGSLPLKLLHIIGILHADLVNNNKLKPVLAKPKQNNSVICTSNYYEQKYVPFY